MMLLYNTRRKKNMSQKLAFKWLGPYRIYNAVERKKTYMLKELNGSHLASIFAGNRLKKFHSQQQLCLNSTLELDQEVMPTLEDFLATDDSNLSDVLDNFANHQIIELSNTHDLRLALFLIRMRTLLLFLAFFFFFFFCHRTTPQWEATSVIG